MHYVYVLQNDNSKYYIEYSRDLVQRCKKHSKTRPSYKLVYYEAYKDNAKARERERKLKQYGSAWRGLKMRITSA